MARCGAIWPSMFPLRDLEHFALRGSFLAKRASSKAAIRTTIQTPCGLRFRLTGAGPSQLYYRLTTLILVAKVAVASLRFPKQTLFPPIHGSGRHEMDQMPSCKMSLA